MDDRIDGRNTAVAAGAGAAGLADLAEGARTVANGSSDGAIGDAVTVTNEHGVKGVLECPWSRPRDAHHHKPLKMKINVVFNGISRFGVFLLNFKKHMIFQVVT